MRDAINILKVKYYAALNGNVTINSATVPIYDGMAPDDAATPYIVLGDTTDVDESDKTHDGHNVTILVDCVDSAQGKGIDTTDINSMADQVLQQVRTRSASYLDLSSTFKMVTANLVLNQSLIEQSESQKYIRRLIRIRHLIYEVNKAV